MTQDSQRGQVEKAVSRYSSLFKLPPYEEIIIFLIIECVTTGLATALPFHFSSYGLAISLSLGILLFLATWLGNSLTSQLVLKKDLILNLKRLSFLALSSNMILVVFAFAASLSSASFKDPNLWARIVSLGVFASLSLRFLVFYSLSFAGLWRIAVSVLLQPSLFLALLSIIPLISLGFQTYHFLYFSLAIAVASLGVYLFTFSLNTEGLRAFGIPSLKLFRAFIADWTEGLEKPFEEILEHLSEEDDVKVSLVAFKTRERLKAVIVIPNIHPGPFKNVGSSSAPSLIQGSLEKRLGCVVSVPHGISGHELDLASQAQNEKLLEHIFEASEFNLFSPYATPFLGLKKDGVNASCQRFGDCMLLTLTLAPQPMEDLPLELNDFIVREAERKGFPCTVAIDAHNSIDGPFNPDKVVTPIEIAVATILDEALKCENSSFEVGAAKVVPDEFGIREGMGPGGISVIVVKVGDQKTAYVTIDGNNMVSGLREKILWSLQDLGISNGEILTTDTHVVNAVILTGRGYYPIGEAIDHGRLIEYIKIAAKEALRNLESVQVSCRQEDVYGVRVIGERQINDLTLLVDRVAKKARRNSVLVFPAFGFLLIVLLALV